MSHSEDDDNDYYDDSWFAVMFIALFATIDFRYQKVVGIPSRVPLGYHIYFNFKLISVEL